MSVRPALEVPLATAQSIVDRVLAGRQVTDVANIHGGEVAAVYMITFEGPYPPVILKVYPEALHWKMRKEANVLSPGPATNERADTAHFVGRRLQTNRCPQLHLDDQARRRNTRWHRANAY